MDSADCIECDRAVRARQEGLQCDGCDRWQHRTCKTGISRSVYKATVRGEPEGLQTWYCNYCPRPGMGPATPTLRQEPAATPILREGLATPVLTEEPAIATLRDRRYSPQRTTPGSRSPSPARRRPIRTELNPSSGSSSSPSSSFSSSSDEIDEPEKPTVFRPLFLPLCPRKFRWNPRVHAPDATFIVEGNDDAYMADDHTPCHVDKAFIEDDDSEDDTFWFPSMRSTDQLYDDEVRYEIIENGTKSGHRKLVSTDGYSYTVRSSSARTTMWRCSVRNRRVQCAATVIQQGESFTRGLNNHVHSGVPLLARSLRVRSKLKTRAITHRHLSATCILKDVYHEEPEARCFEKPNDLIRIINRQRSKLRLHDQH